jgi:hypothetical protein
MKKGAATQNRLFLFHDDRVILMSFLVKKRDSIFTGKRMFYNMV